MVGCADTQEYALAGYTVVSDKGWGSDFIELCAAFGNAIYDFKKRDALRRAYTAATPPVVGGVVTAVARDEWLSVAALARKPYVDSPAASAEYGRVLQAVLTAWRTELHELHQTVVAHERDASHGGAGAATGAGAAPTTCAPATPIASASTSTSTSTTDTAAKQLIAPPQQQTTTTTTTTTTAAAATAAAAASKEESAVVAVLERAAHTRTFHALLQRMAVVFTAAHVAYEHCHNSIDCVIA